MKKAIPVLIAFLFVLVFVTCKKKNNTQTPVATYTPTCSGTKSFKTDVFPLIQSSCNSCHSNLANYAQVSSMSSSIRSDVVSGNMPRSGSLTSAQKDIIVCWIDAGAPNN